MTVDTNVLLRAVLGDDLDQQRIAADILNDSDVVIVPIVALCEFAWVLARQYKKRAPEIAGAIRALLASQQVRSDRPIAEAGLAMLDRGGDFADAVIAFDGQRLGATTFLSFDRRAAKLLTSAGLKARAL